ncbi:hypothetical protein KY285_023846 [Solanum tuberosum]|nr:hypothetical protein KY289_025765 [Solanum tuberosum]KAH0676045.1 hypothetical protein KY285_023846 [Solanum tuberosum]
MVESTGKDTQQHERNIETFQVWKKKNSIARITLLSSMVDDLMCEFESYPTAQAMWIALKDKFGGTSAIKLRRLTIKFDTYRLRPNSSIRQHLRDMLNMIRELKSTGHNLSDEQNVQAVIRSLRASWEYMKIHMTHNESIKSFEDIEHHLVLEDERREASKATDQTFLAESARTSNPKQKNKNKKAWKKKGFDNTTKKLLKNDGLKSDGRRRKSDAFCHTNTIFLFSSLSLNSYSLPSLYIDPVAIAVTTLPRHRRRSASSPRASLPCRLSPVAVAGLSLLRYR